MPSLFSPQFYRNNYQDLAHLNDVEIENHFLNFGLLERRKFFCPPPPGMPYGCCLDSYGMRYPDLVAAYKGSHELLYQHLCAFGVNEGRIYTPNMNIPEGDRTLMKTLYSPVSGYGNIQLHHVCRSVGHTLASLTGNGVAIGYVDSGFDFNHPLYTNPKWTDPGEILGDGIDNDGDGFINENGGWDFVDNDSIPQEGYAHGTPVKGVAAADYILHGDKSNRGVAPNSKIAALRVLDNNGYGSFTRIVGAVDFAIANQIRILNISLSFGVSSADLITALKKAASHNIVVVMAAGNDGATVPGWIARESVNIPGIVVGGATQLGAIASFSNRAGANQNYVLAPGENVITTYINGTTAELWGTSLAAPYVSGAIALLFEAIPNLSAAAAIGIIKRTSSNILPA